MSTSPAVQQCKGPDPHPGMIRLPVAPRINHRIRFTPLKARTEEAIQPNGALAMVEELINIGSTARAVLIAGPGDPLAAIELPLATIELLREHFPELTVILRTLGIDGLKHADRLEKSGVSEVELLIDAVDPGVVEQIYAWIRPGFKTLKLDEAAAILCEEQARSIQAFKDAGLTVRIITTCYPTINEDHLPLLARRLADLGADELVLVPYVPTPDADILLPESDPAVITALTASLAEYLPVREGRPDSQVLPAPPASATTLPRPRSGRPNVAVVSSNGMSVDLHLGQAPQLLVYGPRADGLNCLLECRPAPAAGSGQERWDLLAGSITDCFALLTASAGERPRRILDGHGIQVIITQDEIEATVDQLYGGGKKGRRARHITS